MGLGVDQYALRTVGENGPQSFALFVDPNAERRVDLLGQTTQRVVSQLHYQMKVLSAAFGYVEF